MEIKQNTNITSFETFNDNIFLNVANTPNNDSHFCKKYLYRNNNIFRLNSHSLKNSLFSNVSKNIMKDKNFISITDDIIKKDNNIFVKDVKNKELSRNELNELNLKNKSSDHLPKKINNNNNFSLFKNNDINQINNPINRKNYYIYNISTDNDLNKKKKENKIILNEKIYKRNTANISNNSNLYTNYSNKTSRSQTLNTSTFCSDILKKQVSKIIKGIKNKKISINSNDSKNISKSSTKYKLKKNKNKSIDYFAKKSKNKLLNLLNREGGLINFLKSMNIKTTYNFFESRKKSKSKYEMNNLLINSFGLNKTSQNEFSEQLYNLNENFFSAMKKMQKEKAQIEHRNFDDKRNSNCSSLSFEITEESQKKWEENFMENIYKNKLSEYEFNEFKKMNKNRQRKNIIKYSKNFADIMMNLNLDEYEYPNQFGIYKSSRNYISIYNINRIRKMNKLKKDIEEREQFNVIDMNIEQLKNNQKISETEGVLAIYRAGKPRFVKNKFKNSTILKYKGVSGEFFGLPA